MVFKIRDSSSPAYFSSSGMREENRSVLLLQISAQFVCGIDDVRGWRSLKRGSIAVGALVYLVCQAVEDRGESCPRAMQLAKLPQLWQIPRIFTATL
jgi:hypothetical protein